MGNSISLNVLADDGHLTVNSQRGRNSQLNSPFSDASSDISQATSALSDSDTEFHSHKDSVSVNGDYENKNNDGCTHHLTGVNGLQSPLPRTRQCWICYGEEDISDNAEFVARWVSPCKCKGSTKWVHQACLLDWIDSQVMSNAILATNRGVSPVIGVVTATPIVNTTPQLNSTINNSNNTNNINLLNNTNNTNNQPAPRFQAGDGPLVLESVKLSCPQCHAPYKISEAHVLPRQILLLIDWMARVKERALLWSAFGLLSSSIYSVAFSYGLFNGWVFGGKEYLEFIRDTFTKGSLLNRLQISFGIPLMPLFALSSSFSMFTWTYPLVPLLLFDGRNRFSILPFICSSHGLIVDSVIPLIYKRITRSEEMIQEDYQNYQEITDTNQTILQESSSTSEFASSMESSSISETSNSTVKFSILATTGALLFPSISAVTGWLIFAVLPKSVTSKVPQFYRSLIGASVLVTLKDLSRLLHWYQTVRLRKYRRVLDRTE